MFFFRRPFTLTDSSYPTIPNPTACHPPSCPSVELTMSSPTTAPRTLDPSYSQFSAVVLPFPPSTYALLHTPLGGSHHSSTLSLFLPCCIEVCPVVGFRIASLFIPVHTCKTPPIMQRRRHPEIFIAFFFAAAAL